MPLIRYSDGAERRGQPLRPADVRSLGLDGVNLASIRIDHQTRLQFDDAEVVIGTPFRLVTNDGDWMLDPEQRAELGPLTAIYPTCLVTAAIEPNLTLRLTFEDGARIDVPQDRQYEAWEIVGPDSRLIVCPPEGDGTLSVWQ